MNLNVMVLGGNLTRDPELRHHMSATVCKFAVAIQDGWGDKEHTSFVDCTAFGKTAENIDRFFKKGDAIIMVGRVRQERWEQDDGTKRSKVGMIVDRFEFAGGKNGGGHGRPASQVEPKGGGRGYGGGTPEDEIPF
ncbi:MAG TPA: single-stranded DNA-binding protein [Phycisphaerales bacterium]|nr:single-stranded DNA-binding protein [Phycisphaerales bacterium]